jgi:hypothetical protein
VPSVGNSQQLPLTVAASVLTPRPTAPSRPSQFIIDLVSVVPFWIMTLDYNHPFGGGNERDVSSEARLPVLMRIIKLLRMYAARPHQRRRARACCSAHRRAERRMHAHCAYAGSSSRACSRRRSSSNACSSICWSTNGSGRLPS